MADQRLTDKGSLSSFDDNDLIHVVDVSDTTSSAEGTSKKGLWSLFKSTLKTYFDTIYNEKQNIFIVNSEEDIDTLISAGDVGIWIINSDITMTGNITIPAGVELRFNDVKINLNSNTLGFNSTTITSKFQCFEGSGSFSGTVLSNIKPEWFGAVANDDTVDDRIPFNNAMNMINDLGGGVVELSIGTYYLDSRLVAGYCVEVFSNTSIMGQGKFSSIVKIGDNVVKDTPCFLSNSASNLAFSNFEIDGNKSRMLVGDRGTGEDEAIDIKGGQNVTITHMYIHDMAADAIDLDQVSTVGNTVIINNCIIKDCSGIGIHNNWDDSIISDSFIINNGHDRAANSTGQAALDSCGADIKGDYSTINNCTIADNVRGINIASINNPGVIGNVLSDNGDVNIVVGSVSPFSGPVDTIISNNSLRGTLYGIHVKGSQNTLHVYDNYVQTAGAGIGFYVEDCERFDVIGGSYGNYFGMEIVSVDNLSRISTIFYGTQSGVRILTGASGNVLVENCIDDYPTGTAAVDIRGLVNGCIIRNNTFNGRKGVRMLNSGGNPSNITVIDNLMTDMTVVGSGHTIKRNTGYITEAYGSDTIADTNSTVVVSHGLDITPTKISLTSAGNELIWYSTITSTQFTVNRSGTSGALDFSWEAE